VSKYGHIIGIDVAEDGAAAVVVFSAPPLSPPPLSSPPSPAVAVAVAVAVAYETR